ncbi:MAG: hypothetical protein HJJLKODD_01010 [Phycisphaerae bacterium]|nr:hypothetical protein [Phycisphaerae bacterium]
MSLILAIGLPSGPILLAAFLVMICVGALTWALFGQREPADSHVQRRLDGMVGSSGEPGDSLDVTAARGGALATRLAVISKPLEAKTDFERNRMALRLAQAGVRDENAVVYFLSAKMLLLAVGAMLGFVYAWSEQMPALDLFVYSAMPGMFGFVVPNVWLNRKVEGRVDRITFALPDCLDMLVIAVEAGLGIDAAIQRVSDEMRRTYPDLAEEWRLASKETQVGVPRSEALSRMAERTNVSDMRSLVAVLTQAERFGTSIAHTLRVHAETMRIKRRQRAEEMAAKTTVKLLFPLMVFLFPVILIVIMGPAVLRWFQMGGLN